MQQATPTELWQRHLLSWTKSSERAAKERAPVPAATAPVVAPDVTGTKTLPTPEAQFS